MVLDTQPFACCIQNSRATEFFDSVAFFCVYGYLSIMNILLSLCLFLQCSRIVFFIIITVKLIYMFDINCTFIV